MTTITDELRDLDSLVPHPRNYNTHDDSSVRALADAMRLTAYTAPVVCKPDGTVLGGHARRLALLLLRAEGYPEPQGVASGWRVPCRVADCNSVDELRILATDNPDPARLDYDTSALTSLLADLQAEGALEGTWYDAGRLDELLAELTEGNDDGAGTGGEAPEEFGTYDEGIETDYRCPKCGYQWSGQQCPGG